VECREKVEDFFSYDVLCPSNILTELLVDVVIYRSHMIFLFDLGVRAFQFDTPLTVGVTKEVRKTININEAIYTCGK
jgi:hypothetical protein